jgi:methionyl-tRNA formyltransferase
MSSDKIIDKINHIIACNKEWCSVLDKKLENITNHKFHVVHDKNELNSDFISNINPRYIFILHWSSIIPRVIHKNYECIVFHMTDLPYGRGGSPLQNLIVRGFQDTKITALQCTDEVDAGPIYYKEPLSLIGTADEIFLRCSSIIEKIIIRFIEENPKPKEQAGEVVNFKRRKPEDGDITKSSTLKDIFDMIRMLDSKDYPSAFIKIGKFKFEFTRSSLKPSCLFADVKITEEI